MDWKGLGGLRLYAQSQIYRICAPRRSCLTNRLASLGSAEGACLHECAKKERNSGGRLPNPCTPVGREARPTCGPRSSALAGEWGPQSVVDPVGPVGRRNRENQLDHLLLIEMLPQGIEVRVIDVPWIRCQEIGEPKDGPLGWVEELLVSLGAWLTQRSYLFVSVASPLRRSGMRARSIRAPIDDRRTKVCEVLQLRRQL